jgi:hypothetical protein
LRKNNFEALLSYAGQAGTEIVIFIMTIKWRELRRMGHWDLPVAWVPRGSARNSLACLEDLEKIIIMKNPAASRWGNLAEVAKIINLRGKPRGI